MKITIVLGAFLPVPPVMGGAVEKAWFSLAQAFAQRGHAVTLISRKVPEFPSSEERDGVRHLRVGGFDTPRSILWLKLLDFIYSLRVRRALPAADILVTNTFWLPVIARSKTAGEVYVHVARFPKGQMRFYAGAARLQTVSSSVAAAIAREVPQLAGKIAVLPYPRPENCHASALPTLGEREKILLYVGRLHPEKGLGLLLDALGAARVQGWRLIVVGPCETKLGGGGFPYLESLKAKAAKASIPVEWPGAIFDPGALAGIYRSARVFVYPSLAEKGETFGLAPLEAMAHGCAVIVSSLACFGDFIQDGRTGFTFNHRVDPAASALRAKIEETLADDALLARVSEAGYRKSLEYSLPMVAEQYLADFASIAAGSAEACMTKH